MIFGRHINRYYLKHFGMLLIGIIALMTVDFIQLEVPELYRMVINGLEYGMVEQNGEIYEFNMEFLLDKICLPLLIIVFSLVIGRFIWRVCIYGSAIKVETDIRSKMFNHCKGLSQEYYQKNKVGNLMSLFTNDLETIQECYGDGVLMFFDALLLGCISISKMAKMNGILTLFALIPMTFMLIVGTLIGKFMMKKWDLRQKAFSKLSDFSQESFSGIAVIKAFVKEFKELWAFKKLNKENEDINIEFTKISTILRVSVMFFIQSVICIILGYGGFLVYQGKFNAGQLFEYISYFTSTIWPIMAISQLIEMTSRGKASLNRVGELLDSEVNVKDRENVEEFDTVHGDIEFRNLTFRYPGADYNALENVSFKINQGENVGIIGSTGAGKTTIVDLILRTYNVSDGTLFIDGKDVNTMSIHSLRDFCAYVPQDNFLFSDTISNNISFASDSDSMERVKLAATLSDVDDNIEEFPHGYGTVLGERGVTVSGGQKQRISIARALMKNSPILILDDSVSAVDTKTERVIIKNLRENRRGKTTILIAHRVSTVQDMDKIIFVDDGKVLSVGRHEELIKNCPEYAKTVELQKLEDEKEGN